jgi:hypothetical protein
MKVQHYRYLPFPSCFPLCFAIALEIDRLRRHKDVYSYDAAFATRQGDEEGMRSLGRGEVEDSKWYKSRDLDEEGAPLCES